MPPFELEVWEVLLVLKLRQLRKQGVPSVLVHLDDHPAVREVGPRRSLLESDGLFTLLPCTPQITTD